MEQDVVAALQAMVMSEAARSCLLPFFFFFFNTHSRLIRGDQPFLSEAPLWSCPGHPAMGLLYCALRVLGNTSYCRKHQQAAFHTKSPQHVHSPTGCKDWYQPPKPPDGRDRLSQETPFLLCHHSGAHLRPKASDKAFSEISSLQLVPDTLG